MGHRKYKRQVGYLRNCFSFQIGPCVMMKYSDEKGHTRAAFLDFGPVCVREIIDVSVSVGLDKGTGACMPLSQTMFV